MPLSADKRFGWPRGGFQKWRVARCFLCLERVRRGGVRWSLFFCLGGGRRPGGGKCFAAYLPGGNPAGAAAKRVESVVSASRASIGNPDESLDARSTAVALLGRDAATRAEDLANLNRLLSPQMPKEIQSAIITSLSRRRELDGAKM